MKKYTILLTVLISFLTSVIIFSQTLPQKINYQGVLKDASGVVVANGDYNVTFKYITPIPAVLLYGLRQNHLMLLTE